jgi:hypothetical protein
LSGVDSETYRYGLCPNQSISLLMRLGLFVAILPELTFSRAEEGYPVNIKLKILLKARIINSLEIIVNEPDQQ